MNQYTHKRTKEEFLEACKKAGYECLNPDDYKTVNDKLKVRHFIVHNGKNEEHVFEIAPQNLYKGRGCSHCKFLLISTEEYNEKITKKFNGQYTLISEYTGTSGKGIFKCNLCQKEFERTLSAFWNEYGCKCNKKKNQSL